MPAMQIVLDVHELLEKFLSLEPIMIQLSPAAAVVLLAIVWMVLQRRG